MEIEIGLGRRPRLDGPTVVRAALARLEAGGPGSFTLRGVARDLGVYVNNVTHHAESREALLRAAVDLALADVPPPQVVEDVPRCARELRAALLGRPGVVGAAVEVGLVTTRLGALTAAFADVLAAASGDTGDGPAGAAATAAAVVGAVVVECSNADADGSPRAESAFAGVVEALLARHR